MRGVKGVFEIKSRRIFRTPAGKMMERVFG